MHQTQWVEASRETMESGGFPGNFPGKRQTQWVKRVTGDKSAFRAQEAFGRVLFEKHLFSGFLKIDTQRQKGHLSLAYASLTCTSETLPNGYGKTPSIFFLWMC